MKFQSAFTPLRLTLMIFMFLVNLSAALAYVFADASWSRLVGIISIVFILMLVFLVILELVWLISFKKQQTDLATIKSYQKAINIYWLLFSVGFISVYLVLA